MQYPYTFFAILVATCASAAPLNINLGAYSPALVVGDGEISFSGAESAAVLVNTLEGAATAGAAGGAKAAEISTSTAAAPVFVPAEKEKRELAGFNAALNFATGALTSSPTVELGTGEGGSGVGITVKPASSAVAKEAAPAASLNATPATVASPATIPVQAAAKAAA